MRKLYIIEVDESEIVECWNAQGVKEIGYQEYALKKCPEIKVKPYNPTGDCISRKALKEEIASYEREFAPDWVLNLINNAPPVEVFTLEDMQNNFDAGVDSVIGKYDRPKGEWLEYNATGKKQYMCSVCSMKEKNPKIARYCYWCGAKMKGGAEE